MADLIGHLGNEKERFPVKPGMTKKDEQVYDITYH